MLTVLLTGGLGFIGSHLAIDLIRKSYRVVILDNLVNSQIETLNRIEQITKVRPLFFQVDLRDPQLSSIFSSILRDSSIDIVIHLAGLKAVPESIREPILYYDNNVGGTLNLLKAMEEHQIRRLIFSSSATVYGSSLPPLNENSWTGLGITNPYGDSKYLIERILMSSPFRTISLRYFNPVGAHPSGLLGESPNNIPNNLMPHLVRAALNRTTLGVFGDDYPTPDGTCIRDFIHIADLSRAHVKAIEYLIQNETPDLTSNSTNSNANRKSYEVFNIGTGKGTSVMELIKTFERVNGITLNLEIKERRDGDQATTYCDNRKALTVLKWRPKKTIEDICRDSWRFQLNNRLPESKDN